MAQRKEWGLTIVQRRDFHVTARDGMRIAIREVTGKQPAARVPMVLIHGTRIPGLSEFDLQVPGGSLAADLALKGHHVYILDARGYGRSDRPAEMEEPPRVGAPSLCRSVEIVRDVEAAVDHLRAATGRQKVALLGWGVGSTIMALYATLNPEKVSHLIGYLMVYGAVGEHPYIKIGSQWDDPERPGRFNKQVFGNYTWNSLELLDAHWNRLIPVEDKDSWRDPSMFAAFRQALIDGDPKGAAMDPPMYRSPNGMLEDLWTMACRGETLFSATNLYCKVMIVRAEHDELCRAADMLAFLDDLVNAEEVVYFQEPNTTHYMLLDRPEHGRNKLLAQMDDFLR
jgi:pimeloyl-ACP methyl ester carboxylesterase